MQPEKRRSSEANAGDTEEASRHCTSRVNSASAAETSDEEEGGAITAFEELAASGRGHERKAARPTSAAVMAIICTSWWKYLGRK